MSKVRLTILVLGVVGIVLGAMGAGIYLRGTASTEFVLDYDNTSTGANTVLKGNRGSSGDDWSIAWDETNDEFSLSHPVAELKTKGPYHDVTAYGASGSNTTTTGTMTDNSSTLTVASATTWTEGDGIAVLGAYENYVDLGAEPDTDSDFTDSGAAGVREWMARKFTAGTGGYLACVTVTLGKTGVPDGDIYMAIYTDSEGLPSTQIGGVSDNVSCNSLSADAGGASQTFQWSSGFPIITNTVSYWVVMKTTAAYDYTEGATEVRWRTDTTGGSSECAQYRATGGVEWALLGAAVDADIQVGLVLHADVDDISGTTFTLSTTSTMAVTNMPVYHDDRADISSAITAAANGVVLFPPGTYNKWGDALTAGSSVAVRFMRGATMNIMTSSFTVSGNLEAGPYQIFDDYSSAQTDGVNLAVGSAPCVYPQWFGAIGDDSTDCADAFNKALNVAADVGVLYVPTGVYRLSTSINNFSFSYPTTNSTGVLVQGAGVKETILKYMGTSGYCIDICSDEQTVLGCHYVSVRDLQIQAPELTSAGGGIEIAGGSNNFIDMINFHDVDDVHGTCINLRRRNTTITEAAYTVDTERDFTNTGATATEKRAYKFTSTVTGRIKTVTARLGRQGSPNGTIAAYVYSDDGGSPSVPNAQIGGASDAISCSALTEGGTGADTTFTFTLWADMPEITTSTAYWVVLGTTGYDNYVDDTTEIWIQADAGASSNEFGTYDGTGASWSASNDGANHVVVQRTGQCLLNHATFCQSYASPKAAYGVQMEDDSQLLLNNCNFVTDIGIVAVGNCFVQGFATQFSATTGPAIHVTGGTSRWEQMFVEGGGETNPTYFDGGFHVLRDSSLSVYFDKSADTVLKVDGNRGPLWYTDDGTLPHEDFRYLVGVHNSHGMLLSDNTTTEADANSLNGTAIKFANQNDYVYWQFSYTTTTHFTFLAPGAYKFTAYVRETSANSDSIRLGANTASGWAVQADFTPPSTDYRPYSVIFNLGSATYKADWVYLYVAKKSATVSSDVCVSHVVLEYVGPDKPFRSDLIIANSEPSNDDEAREGVLWFYGNKADGSQVAMANIMAQHDGAGDDDKGTLILSVNDGDDKLAPSKVGLKIPSDGGLFPVSIKQGADQGAAGAAAGELWVDTDDGCVKMGT